MLRCYQKGSHSAGLMGEKSTEREKDWWVSMRKDGKESQLSYKKLVARLTNETTTFISCIISFSMLDGSPRTRMEPMHQLHWRDSFVRKNSFLQCCPLKPSLSYRILNKLLSEVSFYYYVNYFLSKILKRVKNIFSPLRYISSKCRYSFGNLTWKKEIVHSP